MSDSATTSNISPSVPFSSVKPASRAAFIERRAAAQADLDLDAGALERLAQVLRLRRALRAPADHADLLDALERLGQQREQVAAADDHRFFAAPDVDHLLVEDLGLKIEIGRHRALPPWLARSIAPRIVLRKMHC